MGIVEPRDLGPMTRQPMVLGYIQPAAQERFLASTGLGLELDAELGRLAGLYEGVAPAGLLAQHQAAQGHEASLEPANDGDLPATPPEAEARLALAAIAARTSVSSFLTLVSSAKRAAWLSASLPPPGTSRAAARCG